MELQSFKLEGTLELVLRDTDGSIVEQHAHNIVTNVGLAYIASRMVGTSSSVMSHMALGSGATAAAASDTALGNELGRVALDSTTLVTVDIANDAVEYVAEFPAGTATGSITEAGVFNAGASGLLLCRSVFAAITKSAGLSLTVTWKVQVKR